MSRIMEHFLALENRKLTILTATSGDTGSAVANAFYGLQNINVIILFPIGEVSLMQRKQMTTLGKNITVVAVDGKFDDCQHLVKKAFLDDTLREIPLSSANSINIGRMLPQIVYYIYAWSRLAREVSDRIIFSVPSGNFGNLSAGLFAKKMGLPVEKFIVATNSNDEVPVFLKTREYTPLVPSKNCISSAMNVGHPSNLSRLIALYDGIMDEKGKILKQPSHGKLLNDLYGVSVSDDETRETIARVWQQHNVLLEPHGAVAWKGVTDYSRNVSDEGTFISLETAHPAKFPEELKKILNFMPELPPSLREVESGEEKFETITSNYSDLKKLILHRH
jgi:threonine synthase